MEPEIKPAYRWINGEWYIEIVEGNRMMLVKTERLPVPSTTFGLLAGGIRDHV